MQQQRPSAAKNKQIQFESKVVKKECHGPMTVPLSITVGKVHPITELTCLLGKWILITVLVSVLLGDCILSATPEHGE